MSKAFPPGALARTDNRVCITGIQWGIPLGNLWGEADVLFTRVWQLPDLDPCGTQGVCYLTAI
eukprot:1155043-Pelagomonas_calceolata.AAC.3